MPPISGTVEDKIYEFSDRPGKKGSLFALAELALQKGSAKDVERCKVDDAFYDLKYRVEFWRAGIPLVLRHQDEIYKVWEVRFVDHIEEVRQELTTTPLAYEQKTVDGALAWVLLSRGAYHGKESYTQHSFRQLPDGRIQCGPPTVSKLEGMHTLSQHVEMVISNPTPPTALATEKQSRSG